MLSVQWQLLECGAYNEPHIHESKRQQYWPWPHCHLVKMLYMKKSISQTKWLGYN